MSFFVSKFYLKHFSEDIKDAISKRIIELKEWSNFDLFNLSNDLKTFDVTQKTIDDPIHQRDIWANIAKLSVDYWRDYEHYQSLVFKSKFEDTEYDERLDKLGFLLEDGYWKSVKRPNIEVVKQNIFMYCIHLKICENAVPIESRCAYCDGILEGDQCSCGASVIEQEKLRETIIQKKRKQNELDSGIGSTKGETIKKEVLTKIDREFDENEWKCKQCECRNEKTLVNCQACGATVTLESAEQCPPNMPNTENEWKCGKCGLRQLYGWGSCQVCNDKMINGQWSCNACTFNNSCKIEICVVCSFRNKYLKKYDDEREEEFNVDDNQGSGANIATEEKIVKDIDFDDQWQCKNCQEMNEENKEHCSKCFLRQDHSDQRGQECKQMHKSKERKVWICDKCRKINKIAHSSCKAKDCKETRYAKFQCDKCSKMSDGKDDKCRKCCRVSAMEK